MSFNLLFVPYRKTEKIEFGKNLRDIIAKEYFQTPTVFENDIQEVDILRNDIIDLQISTQDLALLKRYYINLSTLESKFPKDVQEFPWFGTLGYHITGPVKFKSFLFERINILYNIASLYTQLGVNQDRNIDEGLKKSCLYFQFAATYYQFIIKIVEENSNIIMPLDLQKNTIETLRLLSLAQSQEVFWQKAFLDKVKDSLIAKLAIQVSDLYDKALEFLNKSEGFRNEWAHHLTVKKLHFEAAAEYRASLTAVSASKYGEEVARLIKASKAITTAEPYLRFVSPLVKQDIDGLSKVILENLQRAEKDNDLIYLQEVPNELPGIVKASVTKDMDINEIINPYEAIHSGNYGRLLFKDLLPFYVIQAADAFRERQEDYITKHINTPIKSLNTILDKFLVERGLPGSLDAVDEPQSLPNGLLEHHQEIKSQGGAQKIKEALNDIQKLSLESEHLIRGAKDRLRIEAKEDELLRSKQGSVHWTRDTSEIAASSFHERIEQLENYLKQAKSGDVTIRNQFFTIETPLEVLSSSETKILEFIPNSKTREIDPLLRKVMKNLKDSLNVKRKIEIERESFLETVEIKSTQYNILPKIISEYKAIQANFKDLKVDSSKFEPVFDKHIKNFNKDLEFIEKQKIKQRELETQIDELNIQFTHLNSVQDSNKNRENVLKTLDAVYGEFKELINNLSQGLKFYNDFNNNCHILIGDIDSYVYERRIEARDLEAELNSKFQKLNIQENLKSSKIINHDVPERNSSPALVSPKPQSAKSNSKSGVWKPGNSIKFD